MWQRGAAQRRRLRFSVMKQYTTPEQTAKLIELGFVPKVEIKEVQVVHSEIHVDHDCHFAIGDLIEMLPTAIEIGDGYALSIYHNRAEWMVSYDDNGVYLPIYSTEKDELIDALYDMIIKLKEEGAI